MMTELKQTSNQRAELTESSQMIWFNYRKEPAVYINGQPCTPRDTSDLHHNMNLNNSIEEMDNLER